MKSKKINVQIANLNEELNAKADIIIFDEEKLGGVDNTINLVKSKDISKVFKGIIIKDFNGNEAVKYFDAIAISADAIITAYKVVNGIIKIKPAGNSGGGVSQEEFEETLYRASMSDDHKR